MTRTDSMSILIEDMPRDLVDRVKAKGKTLQPPISMKWIVRLLLEAYLKGRIELPLDPPLF